MGIIGRIYGVNSLARRLYLFEFSVSFVPIATLFPVMFLAHRLSTFQISIAIATWAAATVVFEVPSGALADRLDRRHVLAFGQALTALGFLLWLVSPTFIGYVAGFVIWGLGGSMHSGTFEAFAYDELKSKGREADYAKIAARSKTASMAALVASALAAIPLVHFGFTYVLAASFLVAAVAAGLPLSFPKASRQFEVQSEHYFQTLKRGLGEAKKIPGFVRILGVLTSIGCITDLLDAYTPLFVSDASFAPGYVAFVGAAITTCSAAGSLFVSRLKLNLKWHTLVLVFSGVVVLMATLMTGVVAVVAFGIGVIALQTMRVLSGIQLQHVITGDLRATSTSLVSFSTETFDTVGMVGLGALAGATSRSHMFMVLSTASFAIGLMWAIPMLKSQRQTAC